MDEQGRGEIEEGEIILPTVYSLRISSRRRIDSHGARCIEDRSSGRGLIESLLLHPRSIAELGHNPDHRVPRFPERPPQREFPRLDQRHVDS